MKGCQFDKNFSRFQPLIMQTRTGRHELLAISFPQGYKIGYESVAMVQEIIKGFPQHELAETAFAQ